MNDLTKLESSVENLSDVFATSISIKTDTYLNSY